MIDYIRCYRFYNGKYIDGGNNMALNRREFLKSAAAASAASAVGIAVPSNLQAAANDAEKGWRWDKAACRFCGTGCGIMLATKGGKIVAVKGDPAAPVNRGLNCIKGYFNAKIMYGADRLKTPLLRMNDKGEFDKKGKFRPVSWQRWKNMPKKPLKRKVQKV